MPLAIRRGTIGRAAVIAATHMFGISPNALAQGTLQYDQLPPNAVETVDASQLAKARRTGRLTVPLPGANGDARAIVVEERRKFGVASVRAQQGETRILITSNGADVFGIVQRGQQRYLIDTVAGTTVIADEARLATGLEGIPLERLYDDVVIDPESIEQAGENLQHRMLPGQASAAVDPAPSTVDIAIFYEQTLEEIYGFAGIRTRAQFLVDYTNDAFRTNGLPLMLRLVYVGVYPGVVPADPWSASSVAAGMALDYGADLKHLLFDLRFHPSLTYAGKASLFGWWGVTGASYHGSTFRHEVGHNFGANHDRANVFGNVPLPINKFNFADRCGSAGTAMHYWVAGVQSLRDHFSDPSISFEGEPCGVAVDQPNAAHNARAINETRSRIAAFQPPQVSYGSVSFDAREDRYLEGSSRAALTVRRDGDLSRAASVEAYSIDLSAKAGLDYEPVREILQFAPGQAEAEVHIQLLDDDAREPSETFKIVLAYPVSLHVAQGEVIVTIDPDLEIVNPEEELAAFSPTGVLRWASVSDEDAYEVWVYRDSALTQFVETSSAITARNYRFARLSPGQTFYVRIYYRVGGTWVGRDAFSLRTTSVTVAPRLVNPQEELDAFTDSGMLRWSAIDGAEAYEVWIYADANEEVLLQTSGPIRETQFRLFGLAAGSTIYVKLFSRIAGMFYSGESVPVVVADKSLRARALNPQEELDSFAPDGILRWTAVSGATAYEAWVFANPNASVVQESSGTVTARSYQTRTLSPGTDYYVQVFALVDGQWQVGAPFRISTATFVTKSRITNPQDELESLPPEGVLRWTAVPRADQYELWFYTNAGLGGVAESYAAGSSLSYQPLRLCAGATYFVSVYARIDGRWTTGWPTRVTLSPSSPKPGCVPPAPLVTVRTDKAQAIPWTSAVSVILQASFATTCYLSHTIDGQPGALTNAIVPIPQTWTRTFGPGMHVFSLRCVGTSGTSVAQAYTLVSESS